MLRQAICKDKNNRANLMHVKGSEGENTPSFCWLLRPVFAKMGSSAEGKAI
jgi:hypothetical protein